jgi:hypothetical protein
MLKIILTLAVVAAIGTLSGCGGMFGDAVRHVRTPDADICQKTMGLPIDDAEEELDMGSRTVLIIKKPANRSGVIQKETLKRSLPSMQPAKLSRLIANLSIKNSILYCASIRMYV